MTKHYYNVQVLIGPNCFWVVNAKGELDARRAYAHRFYTSDRAYRHGEAVRARQPMASVVILEVKVSERVVTTLQPEASSSAS